MKISKNFLKGDKNTTYRIIIFIIVGLFCSQTTVFADNSEGLSSNKKSEYSQSEQVECIPGTIKVLSGYPKYKITDSSAKKVGEDINTKAWISFTRSGKYLEKGDYTFLLDTRVKLKKKTSKGAKVCEHVYVSKNFF